MKTTFTCAFLLITFLNFSQSKPTIFDDKPYIDVMGTAEMEVIPDEIYIQFTLKEKNESKTKITIESQEEQLKSQLNANGIDLKNLYLSDANSDYVKVSWRKKEVVTQKDYTLKVGDAAAVSVVFMLLEKLQILDAYISKVNHSKMVDFRKEVKIKAIQAAKEKSDYLLESIGEKTGKPLVVKEQESDAVVLRSNVALKGYIADEIENNELQFKKIKIQSSIYVKFSIQ
jgi:uncharacterized protein YggE